jgi:uncharacterized phage protein gp47/JayE
VYEALTYSMLLERMLERVPSDVDKREGSVIYDALAPAAAELAELYAQLDIQLALAFAETSSAEFLDRRAADFGVTRQAAVQAKRLGRFYGAGGGPMDVALGSRFAADGIYFVAQTRLGAGQYELVAEQPGTAGNEPYGTLLPVDYIGGLARAELADIRIPGEAEESDEELRARYLYRVRNPSSGGNAADYRNWALEVSGVGGAKVYPLWNGAGSVKVVIVDSEKQPASLVLVLEVADYIEHVRPIGAEVTVVSATAKSIQVEATVTLAPGYALQAAADAFALAVELHFRSLAFAVNYVSLAQIGQLLLSVPGVLDYTSLLLNGGTANVALAAEEIPALAGVDLEV